MTLVGQVARSAVEAVRAAAIPLGPDEDALAPLFDRIGDARFVLLGEATHGTHEFYALRAGITRRLVERHGFRAVALEADGPDAHRVNRFVRGLSSDREPAQALAGFRRFPSWMWRNEDFASLVGWLRAHDDAVPPARRAGVFGLDLYSLFASIETVLRYLDAVDPAAAREARARYACLERFRGDERGYGYAATFGISASCEEEVLRQLVDMRGRAAALVAADGRFHPDDHFHVQESARLVHSAEAYYRAAYRGDVLAWNLRDRHMADTLDALASHLERTWGPPAKVVVWAHNSHLGDARATELGDAGEWNLGQLCRERHGDAAFLVGFTTHRGTVTAATRWDGPALRRDVVPALEGSYESLFHATGLPAFLLFPHAEERPPLPPEPLLQRAIGVVYRPESERESHWFEARLARQFDAVVHVDATTAVAPLDRTAAWEAGEAAAGVSRAGR